MSDLSAIIGISADATGVELGVSRAKQSLTSLGAAAQTAGQQVSGALGKSGDGADIAAQKVQAATQRQINSLKLLTAELEAGGKQTRAYQEALASVKGNDVAALKPYLEQLDAVKSKQLQVNAALQGAAPALDRIGISAKQTAAALRGVPAQFTDIVTSLQGGQAPLTVLLQQGGQLKDMFGGAGNAARALGGYVVGLINPITIAAAAVGGLAVAYTLGAKEAEEYSKAIILTGNASGVTASQLGGYAQAISAVSGTQGKAAEALTAFVAAGVAGGESLKRYAAAAVDFEKATGTAVGETAKKFAELGKSPLEAIVKLNESTNFLTVDIYKQVKALEAQGRTTEAVKVAQDALAANTETASKKIIQNIGFIETSWKGVLAVIKTVGDATLNVGRQKTGADERQDLVANIARAEKSSSFADRLGSPSAKINEEIQGLKTRLALLDRLNLVQADAAKKEAERAVTTKLFVAYEESRTANRSQALKTEEQVVKAQTRGAELIAKGLITEKDLRNEIAAIRAKGAGSGSGGVGAAKTGESEIASLKARIDQEGLYLARLKERGLQAGKLTFFEDASAKIQRELETSITGVTRAAKEKALAVAQSGIAVELETAALKKQLGLVEASRLETLKQADAAQQTAQNIRQQAREQEAANASAGKGKTAIAELRLEEARRLLQMADGSDNFSPAYVAALDQQVQAHERLVASLKGADYQELARQQTEYARAVTATESAYAQEAQLAGLTAVQRDQIVASRRIELQLAKQLAEIDRASITDAEKSELKRRAELTAERETQAETSKILRDENDKTARLFNEGLTDAILRSGKDGGKSLRKFLTDELSKPFKILLQSSMQGISGSIANFLGGGSSGSSGLSSLLSGGSSVGSMFGSSGGGLVNNIVQGVTGALGLGAASTAFSAAAGTSVGLGAASAATLGGVGFSGAATAGVGFAGSAAATGGAAAAATGGAGLATALAGIPVYGWIALGVALLLSSGGGETRSGQQIAGLNARPVGSPSGGNINGGAYSTAYQATTASINDTFKAIGSSATLGYFEAGIESSKNGKGFAYAGGVVNTGSGGPVAFGEAQGQGYMNRRGNFTPEQAAAAGAEEFLQAYLQSLQAAGGQLGRMQAVSTTAEVTTGQGDGQSFTNNVTTTTFKQMMTDMEIAAAEAASDIPKSIRDILRGVDVNALAAPALQALVGQVQAVIANVEGLKQAAALLPFDNLKNLSFDAAAGLVSLADALDNVAGNGLQTLTANLGTYFQNFYTAEEQRQQAALRIQSTVNAAGGNFSLANILGASREQFRAEVDRASKLTDEAGKKYYITLLSVAGAFAAITPATEQAISAIDTAAQAALDMAKKREEMLRSFRQSVIDLPFNFDRVVPTMTSSFDAAGAGANLAAILKANQANDAFILSLIDLAEALDTVDGNGLQTLTSSLSTYYAKFYSGEEQRLQTAANIQRTVNAAGANLSLDNILGASRAQFRATVEAASLRTDDAGKSLYVALLSVAGAFDSIAPSADAAANAASALADAQAAAARQAQEAAALQRKLNADATDAAIAGLDRAANAQKTQIQATRDAALQQRDLVSAVLGTLADNIQQLYASVSGVSKQAAFNGSQFVGDALSAAQQTGYLPDNAALQQAVGDARGGINSTRFSSQADADFARLVLAGQLKALEQIAGPQLTAAEQSAKLAEDQMRGLDDLLLEARKQVDTMRGIDTSITSVAVAVQALAKALTKETGLPIKPATGAATPAPGITSPFVVGGGAPASTQSGIGYSLPGFVLSPSGFPFDWQGFVDRNLQDPQAIYDKGQQLGLKTQADQAAVLKLPESTVEEYYRRAGIAKFATGTPYVPEDMLAQIHKGEAIMPAATAQRWRDSDGNSATLQTMEALRETLENLNRRMVQIEANTADSVRELRTVNGRPLRVELTT